MNLDRFRVRPRDRRALARHPPDYTGHYAGKDAALARVRQGVARLTALQEQLYAQNRYALLLIFQGMDAAGKDHVIKHVMSGLNPQGTDVHAFKAPSSEDLAHDYLWRAGKALPGRGRIGIFNRSYYEDVLVVRVHRPLLDAQELPPGRVSPDIWDERFQDINRFEKHLWRNGTIIRKFFLHVSKREQRRRLLERLDDPAKNWKFTPGDLREREKWAAYHHAYEEALAATSRHHAPWYVIPADHKWFTQVAVADIVVGALEDLNLAFPKLTAAQRRDLASARRTLAASR